jgi:hypothetical protein
MATLKTFSKRWLLGLSDKPPVKRTEYTDTDYKYLRCLVQPSGHVSLSVYKAPRGRQRAIRRVLDVRVDDHMPPMSEVRSRAAQKVKDIDTGEASKGEAVTLEQGLRVMLASAHLKERTIAGYKRNVNQHLGDWKAKHLSTDIKCHRCQRI